MRAMTDGEIAARVARELSEWRYEDGALRRFYRTQGWKGAMLAAGAVGHLAEAAWHHPDMMVSFGRVSLALSTHDALGVTEKDFALARRIEAVLGWRPEGSDAEAHPLSRDGLEG